MIQPQELRIGNHIFGIYENEEDSIKHKTICKFLGYGPFNNYYWVENKERIEEFIEFEPIELTEEILLKCGGEKDSDGSVFISIYKYSDLRLYILIDEGKCIGIVICKGSYCPLEKYKHIKYLHQLQNFYYLRTDQELNIEL